MAQLLPFRAWRYDEARAGALEQLVLPLVDKLTAEQLRHLYRIEENAIHLAWPRSVAHAISRVEKWKQHSYIRQDELPALYPYYQRYSLYGQPQELLRRGFIGLVRLNEPDHAPDILVHEDTIPQALHSHIELLAATGLHVAPTHGYYHDPAQVVEQILDQYMQSPQHELLDMQGVVNQIGAVQHAGHIRHIMQHLQDKKIYLADGHHRMASAQAVRDLALQRQPDLAPTARARYHMMYLSNSADANVRILPTHRIIQLPKGITPVLLRERLAPYFDIRPSNQRSPIYHELQGQRYCFGLLLKDAQFIIQLKTSIRPEADIALPLHPLVKALDYTVLHYYLIDRVLGIAYDEQARSTAIDYTKDYSKVVEHASRSAQSLGVVANEVQMSELIAVAEAGARMPQKSTYFYPKVLSGLLYASTHDTDHQTALDLSF